MVATLLSLPRCSAIDRRPIDAGGFVVWRWALERARVGLGTRCLTPHVEESIWLEHYLEGRAPQHALIIELLELAD